MSLQARRGWREAASEQQGQGNGSCHLRQTGRRAKSFPRVGISARGTNSSKSVDCVCPYAVSIDLFKDDRMKGRGLFLLSMSEVKEQSWLFGCFDFSTERTVGEEVSEGEMQSWMWSTRRLRGVGLLV